MATRQGTGKWRDVSKGPGKGGGFGTCSRSSYTARVTVAFCVDAYSSACASPRMSSPSSKRNDNAVTSTSPASRPSTPPVSRMRSRLPDFSMYVSKRTNRRAGFWCEYATWEIFTMILMNSRKHRRT
jgi:hypothetical protein